MGTGKRVRGSGGGGGGGESKDPWNRRDGFPLVETWRPQALDFFESLLSSRQVIQQLRKFNDISLNAQYLYSKNCMSIR